MIPSVHPSVRITNTAPNARHRGGKGCFALVLAPAVALVMAAKLARKRTR